MQGPLRKGPPLPLIVLPYLTRVRLDTPSRLPVGLFLAACHHSPGDLTTTRFLGHPMAWHHLHYVSRTGLRPDRLEAAAGGSQRG
jgi:hypothetical protein